jgi:hypothetical protein
LPNKISTFVHFSKKLHLLPHGHLPVAIASSGTNQPESYCSVLDERRPNPLISHAASTCSWTFFENLIIIGLGERPVSEME